MKNAIKKTCLLALCAVILVSLFSAMPNVANAEDVYTIDTPYEYPIKPGMDEWNEILNHATKVEMLQIPEHILEEMTTRALAETVLEYPYLVDMYAYGSTSLGYEIVSETFNGLKELGGRPDGLSILIEIQQEQNVQRSNGQSIQTMYLNVLIDEMTRVAESTENTANNVSAWDVVNLSTPAGGSVEAIRGLTWVDHNTSFNEQKTIQNTLLATYPSATIYQNVAPEYNCHSFAWYSKSVNNNYWINDPSPYWLDGSYEETSGWTSQAKIFYDNGSLTLAHSAIATSTYNVVRSKWGCNAAFTHELYDCPYIFSRLNIEYYI